jgi:methyl-accepting chemotaxis protein
MASRDVGTRTKEDRGSPSARAQHVLLEQIHSQMNVVVEAVTGLRDEFKSELAATEARLSERISVLEQVVRQNSEDIRKNSEDIRKNSEDIRKNSEDIRDLREELARLRHDFDHRSELDRLESLEDRVAALEARLGERA